MHAYRSGHVHAVTCVANHETTLLSASDKTIVVTDMVNAKVKQRLSAAHMGRINDVALRNDTIYASASYDGTLKLWDARNHQRYTPIQSCDEAKDSVTSVILDGPNSFYSSSVDGNVRLYDIRQGRITCCNVGSPIVSLSVADDCVAASCLDGTIRLIEKDLGELLNTYHTAHSVSQYAVQCAITSKYVVTGSEESGIDAALYDLVQAKAQQILKGSKERSTGPTCAVDAKDHCIVTASYNGKPLVWTNDTSQIVNT